MSDRGNSWLYTAPGLAALRRALRPGGGLAIWSIGDEPSFERRLQSAGFTATQHRLRAHVTRGPWHVIFVGHKP